MIQDEELRKVAEDAIDNKFQDIVMASEQMPMPEEVNEMCRLAALRAVLALGERIGAEKQRSMEPTEKMRKAGNDTGLFERDYPRDSRRDADTVFRAMQSAAPLATEGE